MNEKGAMKLADNDSHACECLSGGLAWLPALVIGGFKERNQRVFV